MIHLQRIFLLLSIYCFSTIAQAVYPPTLTWSTIETDNFLIHYHQGLQSSAKEIAGYAGPIHTEISEYFDWIPRGKTHVILSDQSEFPNGSATPFPQNTIEILMTPPSDVSGLENYDNWKYLVFKHEYVHIVHLDKAADFPLHARNLLGRHWFLFPNSFLPRWMTEGLATHLEADKNSSFGRGKSHYFRGLMRNEVINGIKSLEEVNQFQTQWPSGTTFYLYGVYFFNFLEETYGTESIKIFVDKYSHFPIPYFINTVSEKSFGKDMYALWDEFEDYLNHLFLPDLKVIDGRNPESLNLNHRQISESGYNTAYSHISDNNLYYFKTDREQLKQLIEYDLENKTETVIVKLQGQDNIFPHSFDVHSSKGMLLPILEIYDNGQQSLDLYKIDPNTRVKNKLTEGNRYSKAIWFNDGNQIIALNNNHGKHNLDLLREDGVFLKRLWQGESGYAINAFDVSSKGNELVVSMFTPNAGWNLHTFTIASKQWQQLTNTVAVESNPRFIKNDTAILFSSDYNGVYNIYEMELSHSSELNSQKNINAFQLTNSRTVALFPEWDNIGKKLFYTELDREGFNIKMIQPNPRFSYSFQKNINPVENSNYISNPKPTYKSPHAGTGNKPYRGLSYLRPSRWLPLWLAEDEQNFYGILSNGADPLNFHNYQLQILYGTLYDTLEWKFNYINQMSYIYFLLGSRQEYATNSLIQVKEQEETLALIYPFTKNQYQTQLYASYQHFNASLGLTNGPVFSETNQIQSTLAASLNTTANSLRSVSTHSGIQTDVILELNDHDKSYKTNGRATLNFDIYSPVLYRSVFKFKSTFVAAAGDANNTRLGGVSSNIAGIVEYGKTNYSLKGYPTNSFSGTNLHKITVESEFPILIADYGFMRPPIGLNRIILNTQFAAARVGSFSGIKNEDWQSTAAIELKFKSNFGYGRFPFTASSGIAKGFGEQGEVVSYTQFIVGF